MAPPRYYTEEDVRDMRAAVDAMANLARRTGVPPISQEHIDFYLDTIVPTSRRIHPRPTTELTPPAEGEVLAVSTGTLDTEIIIQPAGAPPTFTLAAAAQLLQDSEEDNERENVPVQVQVPTEDPNDELPPNNFPYEFHGHEDDNFNVPYPNQHAIDVILIAYQVPTHANPFLRRMFYRIWTLMTSWTFANNYLYVINRHVRTDLIPIVNTIINFTRRYRNPHEDRWVVLMIWDNIQWLYTLRGEIYLEEATRLTTAGHFNRSINLRRQLGLDTGMVWMNGRPTVPRDASIPEVVDTICRLTNLINTTSETDGWDMLALRQLQTEVNALAWRHDNYTSPTSLTQYQNTAVIALQSGFTIEGRDVPLDPPSNPRETHSHLTRPHHPDRIIVWRPNNITFHGEDSIGSIGCYL
jgi:hypothetical protein